MGLRSDFKRKHKRAATDAEYEALKQERDANADTRLRARIIRCCELAAKGDEVSRLEPCVGLGSRDSTRLLLQPCKTEVKTTLAEVKKVISDAFQVSTSSSSGWRVFVGTNEKDLQNVRFVRNEARWCDVVSMILEDTEPKVVLFAVECQPGKDDALPAALCHEGAAQVSASPDVLRNVSAELMSAAGHSAARPERSARAGASQQDAGISTGGASGARSRANQAPKRAAQQLDSEGVLEVLAKELKKLARQAIEPGAAGGGAMALKIKVGRHHGEDQFSTLDLEERLPEALIRLPASGYAELRAGMLGVPSRLGR